MLTCINCTKFTEPEVVVIERSDHYPLCEECGVSVVDLVERIPLDINPEDIISEVPVLKEGRDLADGEIVEVLEKGPNPETGQVEG